VQNIKNEFLEYILELLEPMGEISSGRMFGGYVVRQNELPIALIFSDEIYFKVDDTNRQDFITAGLTPLTYNKKGKTITVSNWKVPTEVLEDEITLMAWAYKAYDVSLRAHKK
jgi:DNA transformation protein